MLLDDVVEEIVDEMGWDAELSVPLLELLADASFKWTSNVRCEWIWLGMMELTVVNGMFTLCD